jgi:hypothetical protein
MRVCVFVAQCHFFSLSLLPPFLPIDYVLCSRYASIRKRKRAKNKIFVCVWCDVMCWQTRRLSVSLSLSHFFGYLLSSMRNSEREGEKRSNRQYKKRMEKKKEKVFIYIYICVCVLIYLAWVVRMVIGKT